MSLRSNKEGIVSKVFFLLIFVCLCPSAFGQAGSGSASAAARVDTPVAARNVGWLTVRSDPEGAEVYHGDALLGKTPIDHVPVGEGNQVLRFFYPSARAWNPISKTDTLVVPLHQEITSLVELGARSEYGILKSTTVTLEKNPDLFLANSNDNVTRLWMGYAAGATMILSGVLSAYLKNQSDKDFDSYIATNDPSLLASTHRLDTLAGTALFLAEISFGVLTYLLLSQ
jgi:hypothetical protein